MNDYDTGLAGRRALVTGGASGIGLAVARALGAAGAKLVLADIEQPALDAAVEGLERAGTATTGLLTDVSSREAVDALAALRDELMVVVPQGAEPDADGDNA